MHNRFAAFFIIIVFSAGCGQKGLDARQFSGTLEMTEHQLGARVAGRIASLSVEEGDLVKAGQVIAALDRYEQANKDFQRAQALFKQGGGNQQSVEYAQLSVQDQQIISPIDGIVLVKVLEVGEMAGAGAAVVVIGDIKDKWVKVFVPEGMVNWVRMDQKAVVSFDGLTKKYRGHVRYIAAKAEFTPRNVQTPDERVGQAFAVKIVIDDPDVQAHPGVAADVRFEQ